MTVQIITGDCRKVLREFPDESVHCCVTSPPYWGLRDYGVAGQIGLEPSYGEYVATMVDVFREVKRVLRSDGVCFVNLGDSYCSASEMQYILREDCTFAELQNVGLEMFGVWFRECKAPRKGALPEMLSTRCQGPSLQGESELARGGISQSICASPGGNNSPHDSEEQTNQDRCAQRIGGQMRLLRGEHAAILDAGPHSRRWSGPQEAACWEQASIDNQDLSGSEAPRMSAGQVQSALLQLQLRDGLIRLLSSRKFTADEIPSSVRSCFKATACLKPKDLVGVPWRVAFALQDDGWYLRQDIVWAKKNPMPESVTDRCTKAHEYLFLLSKRERYYYDAEAIKEDVSEDTRPQSFVRPSRHSRVIDCAVHGGEADPARIYYAASRNKRSVWEIATAPFPEAHFATFPPALIEPCILAGCPKGGTVLDPFSGAGTTGLVADRLGRHAIGIELNQQYAAMAESRIRNDAPLFAESVRVEAVR